MAFVTLKDMGSDFHRLERFDGGDFVRWQRKMHFLLVTVKVYYVIVNPRPPEPGENEEESVAKTRERLRWDQDDEICRGHILNGMSNTLFDAYHTVKTAKELWNQLERRYITEDATSKRFIVSKFFDYKMVDGRSVMEQFNEIKSILDRYSQHKLALDEFIVVTSIIDKLPPSWKNFRNNLKHRKEDINLDELGTHLRIEEDLRKEEKSKSEGVELIFNRLDDLEVDSRLAVQRKVDVFPEELDNLIDERVAHFTKWEVQQRKDLKGQVTELQEELATCKKELTRATRHGCIAVQPRQKKMPEPRSYDGTREARQVDNFFSHLERYFEALDIDEEKVQWTVASQVELIFNRLDDLEVDSRLTMLERKANVFAEELDDFIKERVTHFTKWEVQWHLERYFEALDIDDEKEKVQTVVMYLNDTAALRWRLRYTDRCDIKTWEKFTGELQRQLYPESIENMVMINLRRLRQKGRIHKYVKEYSALMLKIPEMSERQ
ncbi:hypothetical protein RJ639_007763 [Escallonia herrerae]|uniref:Retrotransposon gag domain-containing protein n=2 Tax=Escallonia herrerae TaxID=1293975 RepID=A0AA88W039_9ASTE|nr:hypothetical protein RJ639_007763 [Escallonia herrerae]